MTLHFSKLKAKALHLYAIPSTLLSPLTHILLVSPLFIPLESLWPPYRFSNFRTLTLATTDAFLPGSHRSACLASSGLCSTVTFSGLTCQKAVPPLSGNTHSPLLPFFSISLFISERVNLLLVCFLFVSLN